MVKAVSEVENPKMLTVYYKVQRESIPDVLKVPHCLNYEATDFKNQLEDIIRGMCNGRNSQNIMST
jgi:uncharacterized tellurite resistance protein B-like protein